MRDETEYSDDSSSNHSSAGNPSRMRSVRSRNDPLTAQRSESLHIVALPTIPPTSGRLRLLQQSEHAHRRRTRSSDAPSTRDSDCGDQHTCAAPATQAACDERPSEREAPITATVRTRTPRPPASSTHRRQEDSAAATSTPAPATQAACRGHGEEAPASGASDSTDRQKPTTGDRPRCFGAPSTKKAPTTATGHLRSRPRPPATHAPASGSLRPLPNSQTRTPATDPACVDAPSTRRLRPRQSVMRARPSRLQRTPQRAGSLRLLQQSERGHGGDETRLRPAHHRQEGSDHGNQDTCARDPGRLRRTPQRAGAPILTAVRTRTPLTDLAAARCHMK